MSVHMLLSIVTIAAGLCVPVRLVSAWTEPSEIGPNREEAAQALSADEAARIAVERHPSVAAARSRVEAAQAALRGARAPYDLNAELAPGAGYTNGNALLSHRLDISGRRRAETRRAAGELAAATARLDAARLAAAMEARTAYFDLSRAREVESASREALQIAREIGDSVKKRVELGESPAIQATRVEIEIARIEQELARAAGEAAGRLASLNVLLGRPPTTPFEAADTLTLAPESGPTEALVKLATDQRPDLRLARALIGAGEGAVDAARAEGRPDPFAEIASDAWSLDRRQFQTRNLGAQMRLSIPLIDGGARRASVDRARAEVSAQQAEYEALRRAVSIEVARSAAELAVAREAALNYRRSILPKTEMLLSASRAGYESGLTAFIEVLEAQRILRQTRAEHQAALFEAVRARAALDRAIGAAPGLLPNLPR